MTWKIPDFGLLSIACKHSLGLRKRPLTPGVMQEEIQAPGQNAAYHFGFVNSSRNTFGLKAKFYRDQENGVCCLWENTAQHFEGYPGIIHGGVTSALVDELFAYAVLNKTNLFGVTLSLNIQWTSPVKVGEPVTGKALIVSRLGRLLKGKATLFVRDNKPAALAEAVFYLPSIQQFQRMAKLSDVPDYLKEYFYCGESTGEAPR